MEEKLVNELEELLDVLKKLVDELGDLLDSLKNLTLRIFQIHQWGLNQKRFAVVENPRVGGKNEKSNKAFVKNNE